MAPTDFTVDPATVEAYVAFYERHGAISSDEGEMMMNALSMLVGMSAVEELRAIIRRDRWDIWDAGDPVEDKRRHAARRARAT